MRIEGRETENRIMEEFGKRVAKYRISLQKTQKELAEEAGVSRGTITRMENGESVQLDNIIRVLKALNICSNFETLVPDMLSDPSDLYKLGQDRQRATAKRYRKTPQKKWLWGEDRRECNKAD